jgi:hypothetical protein
VSSILAEVAGELPATGEKRGAMENAGALTLGEPLLLLDA